MTHAAGVGTPRRGGVPAVDRRAAVRPAGARPQGRLRTVRRGGPVGDRGAFTAELAAGLPALMLLLFVGLTAVTAVGTRLQCVDAAREAALAASRGAAGEAEGGRVAPAGATISVVSDGERVTATVESAVRPLGARLPVLVVRASAVAAIEPGSPGAVP